MWNNEITFLDKIVLKGEHLTEKSIFIGHQIPLQADFKTADHVLQKTCLSAKMQLEGSY